MLYQCHTIRTRNMMSTQSILGKYVHEGSGTFPYRWSCQVHKSLLVPY